jgi:hypothetical protein
MHTGNSRSDDMRTLATGHTNEKPRNTGLFVMRPRAPAGATAHESLTTAEERRALYVLARERASILQRDLKQLGADPA